MFKAIFLSLSLSLLCASAFADSFPIQMGEQSWSRVVGEFTNSCDSTANESSPIGQCTDSKSEAAAACESIGGRLPTLEDYSTLLRSFSAFGPGMVEERPIFRTGQVPHLTEAGIVKFRALFDLRADDVQLWTSSYHISMPDERSMTNAWVLYFERFDGKNYSDFTAGRTFSKQSVLCVRQ